MPYLKLMAVLLAIGVDAGRSFATETRLNLTGKVIDAASSASVSGATVMMYSARVRTGTSTFCPTCYADCGKRATTSADGTFRIESLDPGLIFRVLIVHEGYEPTQVEKVDPLNGALTVEIESVPSERLTPERTIRGQVLDDAGSPVEGAIIEPIGLFMPNGARMAPQILDTEGEWDPLAVTNATGEFLLPIGERALEIAPWLEKQPHISAEHAQQMFGQAKHFTLAASIEARGFARMIVCQLEPNATNEIKVESGVTVIGRVEHQGKPLSGIDIGFVQTDRTFSSFLGHYTIGTREDGSFELPNLPADEHMVVYGCMTTLREYGAISVREFSTGSNDGTIDLRTLSVEPAHSLRGRVMLADDPKFEFAPSTRLQLSRKTAWDTQLVDLAKDGSFEMHGVPAEPVSLSIRVPDYHISAKNPCLDPLNPFRLAGTMTADAQDFVILLERGALAPEVTAELRRKADASDWKRNSPHDLPLKGYTPTE